MYIRPSQPETPRLHNSPMFSTGAHDNKTLYLAVDYETAQHSTSSLHPAFRLLLTSPIASARATRLLAIPLYWLTSFAPRGRNTFTVHSGEAITSTVLAQHERASLRSSKYVGVNCPAAIQLLRLVCYPFFLSASESRLQFYCPKCTCSGQVMLMDCTLLK